MAGKTIIPFGPHHPALTGPVQFDIIMEGERVLEAIPSFGYVHRGIEGMTDEGNLQQIIRAAERVSGRDSFGHGWVVCAALEAVSGIEIPERALYLRTILHELERMQSHMLWLGQMSDMLGVAFTSIKFWRMREALLEVFRRTTGNRIIHSICKAGGMERDLEREELKLILETLEELEPEAEDATEAFLENPSIRKRLEGMGTISREEAEELCVVGPVARASGIVTDVRMEDDYGIYSKLDFEPCLEETGDCFARCKVRINEIFRSSDLVREAVSMVPEGPVDVPFDDDLKEGGHFIFRIEQPGGEEISYAKGGRDGNALWLRIRAAGNANTPAMVRILQDCDLVDMPLLIHSFDPDIHGTER